VSAGALVLLPQDVGYAVEELAKLVPVAGLQKLAPLLHWGLTCHGMLELEHTTQVLEHGGSTQGKLQHEELQCGELPKGELLQAELLQGELLQGELPRGMREHLQQSEVDVEHVAMIVLLLPPGLGCNGDMRVVGLMLRQPSVPGRCAEAEAPPAGSHRRQQQALTQASKPRQLPWHDAPIVVAAR